jgi:hypothetical protein
MWLCGQSWRKAGYSKSQERGEKQKDASWEECDRPKLASALTLPKEAVQVRFLVP